MNILNKIRSFIILAGFVAFLCCIPVYVFFVKEQDTVSLFENRNLSVKEDLNETNFADSSFQNTLEDVLADQFYERQHIVEAKKKVDREIEKAIYGNSTDDLKLTKMGDTNIYQLGNSDYMINGLMEYNPDIEKRIMNRIEQINQLAADYPEIEFYLYRPVQWHETSLFDEVNQVKSYGSYYNQLFKDHLDIPVSFLEIDSVESYKEMFFSSDHHWNYRGAYQGYSDIMTMMGLEEEILVPESIYCDPNATFYGTFSTRTANVLGPDKYCVYDIDYDDVKIIVEGEEIEDILNPKYYIENSELYSSDPYTYHYNFSSANYTPYMQYQTNHTSKENILVIGDSYARAIAHYLSTSFYNAYIVNPGDYLSTTGRYFNYDEFLSAHDIDKVLYMYTIENYFIVDKEWGDIYKNYDIHRNVGE